MIGGLSRPFSISRFIIGLVLFVCTLLGSSIALQVQAAANINRAINYQGRLLTTGGTNVADGVYAMKFSIYNVASAGTALWTASGTTAVPTTVNVQVTDGLFSVLLGDTSFQGQNPFAFDFNQDGLYLGVSIAGDSEMTPRKRLSAVPYAFNSEALQGQYASSSDISGTSGTGTLFALNQANSAAASATRTALLIETAGTSDFFDYLLRAKPKNGADVFSISRAGNVTSTGNFVIGDASTDLFTVNAHINSDLIPSQDLAYSLGSASLRWNAQLGNVTSTNVTTTNLFASGSVSTTQLFVNGTQITGGAAATTATLQTITNNGATTTNLVYAQGGVLSSASSTFTSSLTVLGQGSLQLLSFTNATGGSVTTTNIFNSGTVSTTQLFVSGYQVCLVNGTNCPAVSGFVTSSTWQYNEASNIAFLTTSTQDVLIGGNTTATAGFIWDRGMQGTSTLIIGGSTNTNLLVGTTTYSGGLGSLFSLSGNDILAQGQIGSIGGLFSATGVTVGTSSTVYGDGFLYKNNGAYTMTSVAGALTIQTQSSGDIVLDPVTGGAGTSTFGGSSADASTFISRIGSDLIPTGDSSYRLGNATNRWLGLEATNVTSTSIVTNNLTVLNGITVSTTAPVLVRTVRHSARIDTPSGNESNVVVSGKYAYVMSTGSGNGRLAVVDISYPSSATTVGVLSPFVGGATRFAIGGKYAYAINGGAGSLITMDISNPAQPSVVSSVSVTGTSSATDIAVSGKYAYIARSGGLTVLDIASSTTPTWAGSYTSTTGMTAAGGIALVNNVAYVASANQINAIDVTSSTGPFLKSMLRDTTNLVGARYVAASGKRLYVAATNRLTIVDISTPTGTVVLGSLLDTTNLNGADQIAVANNVVYVTSRFAHKVVAVDVADPANPYIKGVYTDATNMETPSGIAISGLYAYVSNGSALATSGFTVLSLSGMEMGGLNAGSVNAGSLLVNESADIAGQLNVRGGITSDNGGILTTGELGVLGGGTSTIVGRIDAQGGMNLSGDFLNIPTTFGSSTIYTASTTQYQAVIARDRYAYALEFNTRFVVFDGTSGSPQYLGLAASSTALPTNGGFDLAGNYAYVAAGSRFTVIDVSKPTLPTFVYSTNTGAFTSLVRVKVKGHYAYLAQSGAGSFSNVLVYDISNPTFPKLVRTISNSAAFDSNPNSIDLYGNYLYVAGGTRFTVIDITDPTTATSTGSVVSGGVAINAIAARGQYVWAHNGGTSMRVFDVTNPTSPTVSSCGNLTGSFGGIALAGRYAYVGGGFGVEAVDISSTSTCRQLSVQQFTPLANAQSLSVSGRTLFAATAQGFFMIPVVGIETGSINAGTINTNYFTVNGGFTAMGAASFSGGIHSASDIVGYGVFNSLANGTSTFQGAVSSTYGLFDLGLQVGGVNVCLQNGTNCPTVSSAFYWTYDGTNNVLYPTTSTQDVLLGGSNTSSALFVVDYRGNTGSATNTILLGANTTTLVGIGTSTPAEALDVNGNISNILSSTSTMRIVKKFATGDAPKNMLVEGRYAYVVNDGTANSLQIFDISDVQNPASVGSLAFSAAPRGIAISGRYVFTLLSDNQLAVIDVSNVRSPVLVAFAPVGFANIDAKIAISGHFLYTSDNSSMTVFDIANPLSPVNATTVTAIFPSGSISSGVYVQGDYAYFGHKSLEFGIYDIRNPYAPVRASSTSYTSDSRDVFVRNGYAYITGNFNGMKVLDVRNPNNPVLVKTLTGVSFAYGLDGAGRYLYARGNSASVLTVIDAVSSSNPVIIGSIDLPGTGEDVVVDGRYVYAVNQTDDSISIIDTSGIETTSIYAHAAELGALRVQTNGFVANQFTVGGGLQVGGGGLLSLGSIAVASTNTTSTFAFAVSSTNGEFSNRLTVGGVNVCLQNGANCSSVSSGSITSSTWQYNAASNTAFLTTSTQDVLIGGNTTATAGFIFDRGLNGTSTVLIGASTNTNVLIGTSTYQGGLDALFSLSGNDLLVQGQIGSIGGIFSATSVVIGSGSTFLNDGTLYKTTPGDFTLNLNDEGSNWRISTANVERLTVASSGNVGIGLANPQQALDVKGNVQNVLHTDQELSLVSSVAVGIGSAPTKVITQGSFAYLLKNGSESLEVYDVTNPQLPGLVSTFAFQAGSDPISMDVSGKYAYVMQYGTGLLNILDMSNFAAPVIVSTTTLPIGIARLTLSGHYVYVADVTTGTMTVIDVSNALSPQILGSVALNGINPQNIHVYDHYAILTGSTNGYLDIVDISNPAAPVVVGNLLDVSSAVRDVQIQGHYAYGVGGGVLHVIDLTDPTSPVYYTNLSAGLGDYPFLSGRYLYLSNVVLDVINVVDVADPLNPVVISTTTVSGGSGMASLFVDGRYLYTANTDTDVLEIYDVHGAEFNGLSAHSAQVGTLQVLTNAAVANQLTVAGSLQVGTGGILSLGSVGIVVDNNDYTNRLMVGGKNVCLQDGTNCAPSGGGASYWSYDGLNDVLSPSTSSQAVMIGGATTGTALFTADTANDNLVLAAKDTQKVGIGTTTPAERLDVVGNIRNVLTENQDFAVVQTLNPGVEAEPDDIAIFGDYAIATLHGASRVRIFNKSNVSVSGPVVSELTGLNGPRGVSVQGNYAYVIADSFLYVIDISNPGQPTLVSTVSGIASGRRIVASGRYAYVAGSTFVTIYDISNPAQLKSVASYTLPGFSGARDIAVQGMYAYVAGSSPSQTSGTLYILNIANPAAPVLSSSYSIGSGFGPNPEMFVDVQGSVAYMTRSTGSVNNLYAIGVATATSPVLYSTTSLQKRVRGVRVSGRYAYLADADAFNTPMLDIVDVADPTNPSFLKGVDLGGSNGQPKSVAISGRYAFITRPQNHEITVVDIHGIETNGLYAGSAFIGNLLVNNDAQFSNSLSISGGLTIGNGGIQSVGAIAVASTNTTSTFAFAVSSTAGEYSQRLTVGGVNVCLEDGTNCPAGGSGPSYWTYDGLNDLLYPTTSTQDVILGGSTTDTSLFTVDFQGNTGIATNTILLGANTTTLVGIGTSTPAATLDVVGHINNLIQSGSEFPLLSEIDFGGGGTNEMVVDGNTLYALHGGKLGVVDITNSRNPIILNSFSVSGNELRVVGHRAYVMDGDSGVLSVVDISNPMTMSVLGTANAGGARGFDLVGNYAYINTGTGIDVVDVSSSTNLVWLGGADVGANQFTNGGALREHKGFIYVFGNAGNAIYDIRSNPREPVYVTSSNQYVGYDFAFQGDDAYVVDVTNGFYILNYADSVAPVLLASLPADTANRIRVNGRYAYTNNQATAFSIYDIADPANPRVVKTLDNEYPLNITVSGNKLILGYLRFFLNPYNIRIYEIPGIETSSLLADSVEVGTLNAFGNVRTEKDLTVGQSLFVGEGGVLSHGPGNFMHSLTLNGVNVCLQDGMNCPASGGGTNFWAFDELNNVMYSATPTQDLILGDSASATAPFIFDYDPVMSSVQIGPSLNANLFVGTTTYGGGLQGGFNLSGGGIYSEQKIGSGNGLYALNEVTIGDVASGTSMTNYGVVSTYGGQDLILNAFGDNAAIRFGTGLFTEKVVIASSGNMGIGLTSPTEALDVNGNIQNVLHPEKTPVVSASLSLTPGSLPSRIAVQGRYGYVLASSTLNVIDLNSPLNPVQVGTAVFNDGADPQNIAIAGNYAFIANHGNATMAVVDISNPTSPLQVATTTFTAGSNPQSIVVNGKYAYVGHYESTYLATVDISNPLTPVQVATTTFSVPMGPYDMVVQGRYLYLGNGYQTNPPLLVVDLQNPAVPVEVGYLNDFGFDLAFGIAVQGRYAYIADSSQSVLRVVDVSNPASPVQIATTTINAGDQRGIFVAGRYAYLVTPSSDFMSIIDVSNPASPVQVATTTLASGANPMDVFVSGRYAYVVNQGNDSIDVVDIFGTEVNGLIAHSAELGTLQVRNNAMIENQLNIGGGLQVGTGGVLSFGALAVASTNTTSTFTFAVSAGAGEFSNRLTVGGVNVCLEDGTNCPTSGSGPSYWTYDGLNDVLHPTTSTQDVLLGGNTTATAGFIFDRSLTGTSTVIVGGSTNTNLLVGTSTYGGGLNSRFGLSGNDLLTQGMIGSIEGMFSATGVTVGTGTTVYADGNIYRTNGGIQFTPSSGANVSSTSNFVPTSDGLISLGTSAFRWNANLGSVTSVAVTTTGLFATTVSTTNLFVGGFAVCLSSGTNCSASAAGAITSSTWQYNLTNNTTFLNTSTMDVLIGGGNTTSSALFVVDHRGNTGTATNTILLGGATTTFVGIGTSTPQVALDVAGSVSNILRSGQTLSLARNISGVGTTPNQVFTRGNYMYLINATAVTDNFKIFDVSNSASSTVVGTLTISSGTPQRMSVVGNTAYVITESPSRLYAIDISEPGRPLEISFVAISDTSVRDIDVSGQYAYVATFQTGKLERFNVLDRTAMTSVAVLSSSTHGWNDVEVQGRFLYAVDNFTPTLQIYDASATTPTLKSEISIAGAQGLSVQGRFAYVSLSTGGVRVVDISSSTQPVLLGTVAFGSNANRSVIDGRYLYVSNESAGTVSVVDVSSSTAPSLVNTVTVGTTPRGLSVAGKYAYVPNAGSASISIIDLFGTEVSSLTAGNASIGGLQVLRNAIVAGKLDVGSELTVGGRFVCLSDGTGCPSIGGWTESTTNNTTYLSTVGRDVLLGGSTSATAGFIWDKGVNGTSTLFVGATTNTNVVFGVNTTSFNNISGLSGFVMDGNDLLVGGKIGSLGGLAVRGNIDGALGVGQTFRSTSTNFNLGYSGPIVAHGRYLYQANSGGLVVYDVSEYGVPRIAKTATTFFSGGNYNDIAYFNGYILLSSSDGYQVVVDVSSSTNPIAVTQWGNGTTVFRQHALPHPNGRYVYTTNGAAQINVTDMINPASPKELFTTSTNGGGTQLITEMVTDGKYLYVAIGTVTPTFEIYDLSIPTRPRKISQITSGLAGLQHVAVQGDYVYLAEGPAINEIDIVDVRNRLAPVIVKTISPNGGTRADALIAAGRYLYLGSTVGDIDIYDIASSTNPIFIQNISTGVGGLDITLSGRYLYQSDVQRIGTIDVGTMETNALQTYTAEITRLMVRDSLDVFQDARIEGGLTVGSFDSQQSYGSISVYASTTSGTVMSLINNSYNPLDAVLEVRSGCGSGSSDIALFGSNTDDRLVSIRCSGQIFADNGTVSTPADYAEYFFASSSDLVAGDAVVLNSDVLAYASTSKAHILKSQTDLRAKTLGIVSTQPGFVANGADGREADPNWKVVALMGQVPAKASTTGGAIKAGDEIMIGDAGTVMKASGPGMVVGRALEPLNAGTGTIQVYVQPHWWAGDLFATDGSGNSLLVDDLMVTSSTIASATSTLVDSPFFTFTAKAWDSASSTEVTHSFKLFADAISSTTSLFSITNASGTSLLDLSNEGDLTVHGKLYLANKSTGKGSTSTYLFIDDTAPSSTMVSTNADGFQAQAAYDYAERYPSQENLEPGDLVTFDLTGPVNGMKRTSSAQDAVSGIVSTKPGFLTGAYSTGTYPIALAGRVPTKVTASNGAIKVGDALTASNIPGVAMKATQPGIIVGYALENFDLPDTGLVQVFVKTGYFGGTVAVDGSVSYGQSASVEKIELEGLALIAAGQMEVKVHFDSLKALPAVYVTPGASVDGGWWVTAKSDTGFTIVLEKAQMHDVEFSWMVHPLQMGVQRFKSDNTSETVDPLSGNGIPVVQDSGGESPSSTTSTQTP